MSIPPAPRSDAPQPPTWDPSDAVSLIDRRAVIRFATPAAAHLYGYEPEDVVGRSALRFIAPESADAARERWLAFSSDPSKSSDEMLITIVSAAGFHIPVRASAWRLPGRKDFLLVHHVSDRLRDRLETLYAIQAAAAEALELDELLDTVLREIDRLVPCGTSTIFILEHGAVRARRWSDHGIQDMPRLAQEYRPDLATARILRETNAPLIINDCETDPRWVKLPNLHPVRSWLGAPLSHRGEFMGELDLDSAQPGAFTQEDAELTQALAIQVAAALHKVRQLRDEQHRTERYRALSDVNQAISQLGLHSVLELVYRKLGSLMDTSTFFIGLYDHETDLIRLVGWYERGQPYSEVTQRASEGLAGLVLRTRQSLIIHDSAKEPIPEIAIQRGEMPRSLLMRPLVTQDEVVGVVTVQSYVPDAYSPDDIDMFETMAGAIATAVRNAQLYDQAIDRLNTLEALHRLSLDLSSVQDLDEVAWLTVRAALELFKPEEVRLILHQVSPAESSVWIGQRESTRIEPQAAGSTGQLVEQARQFGQPLSVTDPAAAPDLQAEFHTSWPVQAAAACPILRGDSQLATLVLLYRQPYFFRRDMLRTLDLLCHQTATALENARHTVSLRRRLDEVSALQALAREVSSMQSLEEILETVVRTLRDVYQCKSASLGLVDRTAQEVVIQAAAGLEPQIVPQGRFKLGEHVAGWVAQTGQVIYVPDTAADPHFRVIDPDIRSLMVVPLTAHGHVIGTLGIDSAFPHAFTPDHERVLTIAGGQIAAAIETVRLLQEARERADQLAEANARLEAQDELRKELVYQVSHDLRSPLQIVYGYAELMRDEVLGPVTPAQNDALALIVKRSKSIERLTKDIMAAKPISRDMLNLRPVNLTEISRQAFADAQIIYQDSRYTFKADLVPEDLIVEADYDRLNRVFDNLISNAVKFSPDGGTITLRTACDRAGGRALVSLTDQGIGIASDKLPYIFERFYRGDKAFRKRFGGSGLGLYIVQQIIGAHHGRVWAESREGVGSTFTFALPLIER
jgi:PAS domain S-box-containing protein